MRPVITLILAALLASACASMGTAEIPASEFRDYGDSKGRHTVYLGSDATYHYFHWEDGSSGGRWKIQKASMPLGFEFDVAEKRSAFLKKNAQGQWEPWANNPNAGAHAQ